MNRHINKIFLICFVVIVVVYWQLSRTRYILISRVGNPENTHALVFLEDSWESFFTHMPGQGSDKSGIVRLEDVHGNRIRQRKVKLINHLDLRRLEWTTNSLSCIGIGYWTFDNKGSWDWE